MAGGESRIKVAVLKGGISSERDISLLSGENAEKALREKGYRVAGMDVTSSKEEEIIGFLKREKADIVFIALHGEFGEDGQIQKMLEKNRFVFTGSSSEASFLAMDKLRSRQAFEQAGLKIPPAWPEAEAGEIPEDSFPLIVKPHFAGSSLGVTKVENKEVLPQALRKAREFSRHVVVEKFIGGREISVGILGGEALPVVEIIPKNDYYDFSCKYDEGMSRFIVPASLPSSFYRAAQEAARRAFAVLGCRHFGRVDMIVNEKDIYILEVNSIPGLTAHSLLPLAAESAGIRFSDLCGKIVELALQ